MTYFGPIVLASASPRRSRMFEEMGIDVEVVPANIEETMEDGELPQIFAPRVAKEKGLAVAKRLEGRDPLPWIVSADTVVVLDGEVLQKPVDDMDARGMLKRLSGTTHTVITGWAVGRLGSRWTVSQAKTEVIFHELSGSQVDDYVATSEGMDKAGAYAIQGIGAFLVDRIDGNYFNVVGLPISHVVRELVRVGAITRFPNS